MKRTFRTIFAAVMATAAFAGCEMNPDAIQPSAGEQTIIFESEEIGTRSQFTTPEGNIYPVIWSANDTLIRAMQNNDDNKAKNIPMEVTNDGRTSRFEVTFNASSTSNFFRFISPVSAYVGFKSSNPSWTIYIPTTQTPTATSVDPLAQILTAKSETYGAELPEITTVKFDHITAYGKLSVKGLDLNGKTMTGMTLAFESNVAGRWNYYLAAKGDIAEGACMEDSANNIIAINTESLTDVWFGLAPVDMSGKKLTVTVKTTEGSYSKTITFPAERKFEAGKIAIFSVNMSDAEFSQQKKYVLVKNANDLTVGSRVIIAAANYDAAISTTQNGNNRAAASISKSGETIIDPNPNVEVFEVESGATEGTIALNATTTAGYIYAAGGTSSNYLRTQTDKNAVSSWTVSITDAGIATLKCSDKAVTRNTLKYNTNTNGMFSCYASGQQDIAIYKDMTPGTVKANPELKLENNTLTVKVGESAEIGIEGCKSEGAITYVSGDETIATVDHDGMVSGVTPGKVTITVNVAETESYKAGSATCEVTVESETSQTVADIIAGDAGSYTLKNVYVMAVSGANIIIGDTSGCMLLYKYDSGLVAGDIINVNGSTKEYNGIKEFYSDKEHSLTVEKVSSGTADHGTAAAYAESDFEAYSAKPAVKYISFDAMIPVSDFITYVGAQKINLYGTFTDNGRYASFKGYTIGYSTSNANTNVLVTEFTPDNTKPFISVDKTEKIWEAEETDVFSINVTCENGSWTYEASTMDWADITVSGEVITVAPKAANTSTSAKEGTITVKNNADAAQTRTVNFKQKAPAGNSFTLTSDDIKNAHSASWKYDSGEKKITATDGSVWTCVNTYAEKNQVTIQMNKGKKCYILTPSAPTGKTISHLTVTCAYASDGQKTSGVTRTFDITDNETDVASNVKGDDLTAGIDITGEHSQLKIAPNEEKGGACYIVNITVEFK